MGAVAGTRRGAGPPPPSVQKADLVLEGGGVKGIAHVGAISVLSEHGYSFPRAAGTSAGSIAAAFVAAGMPAPRMQQVMRDGINYRAVREARGLARAGFVGRAMSVLLDEGIYNSDYLHRWLLDTLAGPPLGVSTFADLVFADPGSALPPERSYRLVVIVTDVSRGTMVRFPWDYGAYGIDPGTQRVADAVRASASIPFFFKPARLRWGAAFPNHESVLVDGGACSDFPIEIFDRTDDQEARWPTFGIKLSSLPAVGAQPNPTDDVLDFGQALLDTVINGNDHVHLSDPSVVERTIFIDTSEVASTDFEITPDQQTELYQRGRAAAEGFLAGWDWAAYRARYDRDPGRKARGRAAQGAPAPGRQPAKP